jgi:Zn-finger nucleic acid-binding protein
MDHVVEPDVAIDVCASCRGVFLDKGELNELATGLLGDIERRSVVWSEVIHAVEGRLPKDMFPTRICPACSGQAMRKVGLVTFADVIFDHCERCGGFFLDGGEVELMNQTLRDASLGQVGDEHRGYQDDRLVRCNKLIGTTPVVPFLAGVHAATTTLQIVAYFRKPLGLGLQIYRETLAAKLAKLFRLFGGQDIPTGDREFDKAFIVRGHDPDRVTGVLAAPAREAVLRLVRQTPPIRKTPGVLEVFDYCLCYTEGPYSGELQIDWRADAKAAAIIGELLAIAKLLEGSTASITDN